MASFSIYKDYMPIHDDLVVRPRATTLISGSLMEGQLVTVNLAAIGLCDSSATGDCPAAGTGISLYCHYNWG